MIRALLGLTALSVLLSASPCGSAKPDTHDALALSPSTHKLLLENDRVRVMDVTLPARANESQYSHPWPALIIEDTPRPGAASEVRNFTTTWHPAHSPVTITPPAHYLSIEDKQADCQPSKDLQLPPTDGVVIHDPSIKVPFENAHVRVLEIEVKPG